MNSNNKKVLYGIVAAIVLIALVGTGVYLYRQQGKDTMKEDNKTNVVTPEDTPASSNESNGTETTDPTALKSGKGVAVVVTTPTRDSTTTSPLQVTGSVPGSWSSEGTFSVRLLDADSNVLADGTATLSGDWMTTAMVPFNADLTFEAPQAGTAGLLILEKANPSDLEENADSVTIPVVF